MTRKRKTVPCCPISRQRKTVAVESNGEQGSGRVSKTGVEPEPDNPSTTHRPLLTANDEEAQKRVEDAKRDLSCFAKSDDLASFIDVVKNKCRNDEERRQLLNSVVDSNHHEARVLGTAAENGSVSIIEWLLSREAGKGRDCGFVNVLSTDFLENTALHVAALRYDSPAAFFAIINGCDANEKRMLLNSTSTHGETVLHAATYRNPVIVSWLLSNEPGEGRQSGFDLVLAKDSDKRTALHFANTEATFFAMMNGCTAEEKRELLNAVDYKGQTVLHMAAMFRLPPIIRWLLSNELGKGRQCGFHSVSVRDNEGQTALHRGAYRSGEDVYAAIMNGLEEEEKKAALKIVDNKGRSVLHYARASCVTADLLQYPQMEEKFLNAQDHYGMTPLHFAVLGDYAKICPNVYCSFPPETRCIENVKLLLSRKNIDPNIGIAKIEFCF